MDNFESISMSFGDQVPDYSELSDNLNEIETILSNNNDCVKIAEKPKYQVQRVNYVIAKTDDKTVILIAQILQIVGCLIIIIILIKKKIYTPIGPCQELTKYVKNNNFASLVKDQINFLSSILKPYSVKNNQQPMQEYYQRIAYLQIKQNKHFLFLDKRL